MKITMDKTPTDYSLATYIWVSVISMLGIIVHFLEMHRSCLTWQKVPDLIIDLFIAPILGIFTFYICESLGIKAVMTAGIIGLLSTFGTRGLYFIRRAVFKHVFRLYRD